MSLRERPPHHASLHARHPAPSETDAAASSAAGSPSSLSPSPLSLTSRGPRSVSRSLSSAASAARWRRWATQLGLRGSALQAVVALGAALLCLALLLHAADRRRLLPAETSASAAAPHTGDGPGAHTGSSAALRPATAAERLRLQTDGGSVHCTGESVDDRSCRWALVLLYRAVQAAFRRQPCGPPADSVAALGSACRPAASLPD